MSYLLDRKAKRKKITAVIFAAFLFIVIFIFRIEVWSGLSYTAGAVFSPILRGGNGFLGGVKNLGAYFISKRSLLEANQELQSRLNSQEVSMLNYGVLAAENENLKEILGRKKENGVFIMAAVLAKPNQSAYDTLLIDAGSLEGISSGALVFALGDVPIGRVGEVYPNSAKVVLFSSAGERTPAVVYQSAPEGAKKNVFYDLVGRGGGNFEMTLPRDISLAKGDQVVLPGIYPYVVAIVESLISEPRDPFNRVLMVSPVNMQDINFVEIKK